MIEESPSPHLLPETRRKMIREVKSLVREVNYESAGTVSSVLCLVFAYTHVDATHRLRTFSACHHSHSATISVG